jgi:DNA-binding CsgD family transcriptional regulator
MPQMAFLKHEFGLTPAEARLVLRLVAGDTLKVSAAALGIGYETTRTTLKSVFHKTRTCRQAELVIVMIHAMAARRQADPSNEGPLATSPSGPLVRSVQKNHPERSGA